MSCSETFEDVNRLVDKLYIVSVPLFLPRGTLHIVLRTCTASSIMYHWMAINELGPANAIVTKLWNSARSSGIMDCCFPSVTPEPLLDHWSEIILKDYQDWNPEIAVATADMWQMAAMLKQQTEMLVQLKTMLSEQYCIIVEVTPSHQWSKTILLLHSCLKTTTLKLLSSTMTMRWW